MGKLSAPQGSLNAGPEGGSEPTPEASEPLPLRPLAAAEVSPSGCLSHQPDAAAKLQMLQPCEFPIPDSGLVVSSFGAPYKLPFTPKSAWLAGEGPKLPAMPVVRWTNVATHTALVKVLSYIGGPSTDSAVLFGRREDSLWAILQVTGFDGASWLFGWLGPHAIGRPVGAGGEQQPDGIAGNPQDVSIGASA